MPRSIGRTVGTTRRPEITKFSTSTHTENPALEGAATLALVTGTMPAGINAPDVGGFLNLGRMKAWLSEHQPEPAVEIDRSCMPRKAQAFYAVDRKGDGNSRWD